MSTLYTWIIVLCQVFNIDLFIIILFLSVGETIEDICEVDVMESCTYAFLHVFYGMTLISIF